MTNALSLRFNTQMQLDLQRMTLELSDLQRQLASGYKAADLQGFGAGVAQLVNARSLLAQANARAAAADQVAARFDVQASALSRAAQGGMDLALAIGDAVAANTGNALDVELSLAFATITSAFNETWNGQPLFAGERVGAGPVKLVSLEQLATATIPDDVFAEAERHQLLELDSGAQIALAEKASEIGSNMYAAMQAFKQLLDLGGGKLPDQLTPALRDQLQSLAAQVEGAARQITAAEGRSGQVQRRIADERERLEARSNLLTKEIGLQADADVPTIALKLSQLQAQYEATAKVFSDLSKLSLLKFL